MTRIVLFFLVVLFSNFASANYDKIAVAVNKTPITEKQVFDRKNMYFKMQGINNPEPAQSEFFKKLAVNSLVDDALLESEAKKFNIKVNDQDIDNFLSNLEKVRNLKPGFFKMHFGENKNIYASFKNKVRSEVIKSRMVNELIARSITVSEDEVTNTAFSVAKKDANLVLRKISSKDNLDKSYKEIIDFRKANKTCDSKSKGKNLEIEIINSKLSKLSRDDLDLVSSLKEGQYSAINDREGRLLTYQICSRKVDNISKLEEENIMNYIGNKKVNLKMQRYLESLKKKSYIKYFN